MKALKLDHRYYRYPDSIHSLEAFVDYVNSEKPRFIPLTEYLTEHCKEPYFIKSETAFGYVNMGRVDMIREVEITVFTMEEYRRRLELAIQDHCLNCEMYREDRFSDDPFYYGDKIDLDGKCPLKIPL